MRELFLQLAEEERLIDFTMITSAEKESIKINREYRARLVKG